MKEFINNILTFLFPFQELKDRPSVFLQNSWLDKVMTPTHLKDYLWHNKG
jgi:hypothetical protein